MSGGKGGSQSTKVEIPPFIEQAAKENLARARRTANMGYMPYYGPQVAAFTPMQEQAMRATGGAAEAFGLAGPGFDPLAGMPQAETFDGGMRGYSSSGLFEQALSEMKTKNPQQFAQYSGLPTTVPSLGDYAPVTTPPVRFPGPSGPPNRGGGRDPIVGGGFGPSGYDFTTMPFGVYSGPTVDFFDPSLSSGYVPPVVDQRMQDLEARLAEMQQRSENQSPYDVSGLEDRLAGIENRFSSYQPFDPTDLQNQIAGLRESPRFDPSALQNQVAGLENRLEGITPFNPGDLQAQIAANQARLEGMRQFDPSNLQAQIAELRGAPQFDPSGIQQQLTDLQGRVEGFTPFDASGLQSQIQGLQQQVGSITPFDPSGLMGQISSLESQLGGLQTAYNPAVTSGFNPLGGTMNVGPVGSRIKLSGGSV